MSARSGSDAATVIQTVTVIMRVVVDLTFLLGTRHLALTGASAEVLRPARQLLIFASVVTLALNVADPLVADEDRKAASAPSAHCS